MGHHEAAIVVAIGIAVLGALLAEEAAQSCPGVVSFQKFPFVRPDESAFSTIGVLYQDVNQAITSECIRYCKDSPLCNSFAMNYTAFVCPAYRNPVNASNENLKKSGSSNFFEKVCYESLSLAELQAICGRDRLWSMDVTIGASIEGFVAAKIENVSRTSCSEACLKEKSFECRSASYDALNLTCFLSKENRWSQRQAFREEQELFRTYFENQCVQAGTASCLFEKARNVQVATTDFLDYAEDESQCQAKCEQRQNFDCKSYSWSSKRCALSGDVQSSSGSDTAQNETNSSTSKTVFGSKNCHFACTGLATYERMTGFDLEGSRRQQVLSNSTVLNCLAECSKEFMKCLSIVIDSSGKCFKLDRNSQGRSGALQRTDGISYFEKICLSLPDKVAENCRSKSWAFERIVGNSLAESAYVRTFENIASRIDCEEKCLVETTFQCRSALYDEESASCRLSSGTKWTLELFPNSNPLISYLENQCLPKVTNSNCSFKQVTSDLTRPIESEVEIASLADCQALCDSSDAFKCQGFSYAEQDKSCRLSAVPIGESRPALDDGTKVSMFERKCPKVDASEDSSRANTTSKPSTNNLTPSADPSDGITSRPTGSTMPEGHDNQGTRVVTPEPGTSLATTEPSSMSGPPTKEDRTGNVTDGRCGDNERFQFERITGFEPISGIEQTTLCYGDFWSMGMVEECVDKCRAETRCKSFVLDYKRRVCFGILEVDPDSVQLRVSSSKDYFVGTCVPDDSTCNKLWTWEKIIDQVPVGIQPKVEFLPVSLKACRAFCLKEKRFICSSFVYSAHQKLCRMYSSDRHADNLALTFAPGSDFVENLCAFRLVQCLYLPFERDVTILTIVKTLPVLTFVHCQQDCDSESSFVCRSFTFIDRTYSSDSNLCLLSGDNRHSSRAGIMRYFSRAFYASRDCRAAYVANHF